MITIVIGGQKGGSGKSSSARELGSILAAKGVKILMVDCDPQSSLTAMCGLAGRAIGKSLGEVLGGAQPGHLTLGEVICKLGKNLSIAPADITLASCELGLTARMGRELVLKRALAQVNRIYDLAILDCPPSLGILTVAGLVASTGVIIPTQPAAADLRGLALFVNTISQIKTELNPEIEILGTIITFMDPRLKHHQKALEFINQAGLHILGFVPRSVRMAEAASVAKPVTEYSPDNPTGEAYRKIAEEVLAWLENKIGPIRSQKQNR